MLLFFFFGMDKIFQMKIKNLTSISDKINFKKKSKKQNVKITTDYIDYIKITWVNLGGYLFSSFILLPNRLWLSFNWS